MVLCHDVGLRPNFMVVLLVKGLHHILLFHAYSSRMELHFLHGPAGMKKKI